MRKENMQVVDRQLWQSIGVISAQESWGDLEEYLDHLIFRCHTLMENCSHEELSKLQGMVIAYREVKALNDKAKKELALLPK